MNQAICLITAMIMIAGFASNAHGHEASINKNIKKARKSFAFIKINVLIKPISCSFKTQKAARISVEKCDISDLKPKNLTSVGSGSVIKHVMDTTYVLTAAHVCSHPKTDTRVVGHKEISVSLTPSAIVRDVDGNEYKAEIFSLDTKNDLCILKSKNLFGYPLKLATKMPPLPSLVYSYGAPLGINHPGLVLLYTGYTAGSRYDDSFERTTYFYTLVIRGGSSGSSILNHEGEIIGVVHTAVVGLQKVAIAATLDSIQKIVKHIPKVKYEKTGP